MKKWLIILNVLLVSIVNLKATPQAPDYIIIGNDTLPISQLILGDYLCSLKQTTDSTNLFRFNFRDESGYDMVSTACFRGYQAVYSLENDSLFLKYIIPCHSLEELNADVINNSNEQLQRLFQEKVKNNKVFMDWYSSEFTIPKGIPIWWDYFFTIIYNKEELYTFREGILVDKHIVNNYQKVEGGISRTKKEMSKAIFDEIKKLDWKKLNNDFLCSGEYCIEIDYRGKVINVKKNNSDTELNEDSVYCQKAINNQLKNLQFDIILCHGRPFNDSFCIDIDYDSDTNQLEVWSDADYEDDVDDILRMKREMSQIVFNEIKKLNWKKLNNEFFCNDTYYLEFDSTGKVINVKKNNDGLELDEDDIYCLNVIKNQLKNFQFDITLYDGFPFNDILCIEVYYNRDTNKLENWSYID